MRKNRKIKLKKFFKVIFLIKAISVIADYGNHRFYKIFDVDFTKTPRSTFDKNGKQISLA
jgi:hypothetical protein